MYKSLCFCTQIFKHGETPSNKRKLATTQRSEFLIKKYEEFHKLEHQLQIDSLHNFLLQCASRISEPTEAIESDPQDNEKQPFHWTIKIPFTKFYVKNGFEIC